MEKGKRSGAAFIHKMIQYANQISHMPDPDLFSRQVKLRSHIIYSDSGLNTEQTIYLNVYQNFVLTAMKMHRYIRTWGINTSKNSMFIESKSCAFVIHLV